ncbi:hypothetical protein [Methanofollis fontis]|uniref:hypothetical protein n=1 Tax=Methanofollis fontis TaxID=2052832 RepID=UPI00102F2700|nr:hypothetical protein [Methanofollis fontis]
MEIERLLLPISTPNFSSFREYVEFKFLRYLPDLLRNPGDHLFLPQYFPIESGIILKRRSRGWRTRWRFSEEHDMMRLISPGGRAQKGDIHIFLPIIPEKK